MSIPADTDRDLLTAVAVLRAKAGKEDELRAVLEGLVEPTLKEDGCRSYVLHQSMDDPALFITHESWTSGDDLDAHLATPHVQAVLPRTPELLDGDLVIHRLRRIA